MNRQITTYVFIDASNLWEVQKAKGKLFDFEKLKKFLKEKFNALTIEIFYYSAYPAVGTRDYSLDGKHKFFIFSSQNNISQELRTGGDGYFDVLEIENDIWGKELKHRGDKKT